MCIVKCTRTGDVVSVTTASGVQLPNEPGGKPNAGWGENGRRRTHELHVEGLLDVDLLGLGHGSVVVVGAADHHIVRQVRLHRALEVERGEVLDGRVRGRHLSRVKDGGKLKPRAHKRRSFTQHTRKERGSATPTCLAHHEGALGPGQPGNLR